MKKALYVMALLMCVLVMLSCASNASKASTPLTTQEEKDNAFKSVYAKHYKNLILDDAKTYTVKSGDTLAAITREHYGSDKGLYFPVIMLASSEVVLDPDRINPGMELIIPDLQKNLDNAKARASIKGVIDDVASIEDRRKRPADAKALRDLAASL